MKRIAMPLAALLALACGRDEPGQTAPRPAPPPQIVQFYADKGAVGPGERALLCYGVENAVKVSLTPPVAELFPSPNRCIEVSPGETTTYTLTAVGQDGREATASLTIQRTTRGTQRKSAESPAADQSPASQGVAVRSFTANPRQIESGASSTLCYEVANASNVRVEPKVVQLGAVQRGCFYVSPETTTTYSLEADGGGKVARSQITVTVR